MEEWKDIKGYEGLYQVSNFGRVKSLARNDASGHKLKERIMTNYIGVRGYFEVGLTKNGKNKTTKLHQLIAKSFIPNPENKPHINHKNGIKTDNSIENLEWCTIQENNKHAILTGLNNQRGENQVNSKLTKNQVQEIRSKYIPRIYTCRKLAKEYNVSKSEIHKIITNKNWL